ncbi:hypothetical protein VPHK250G1_0011 [Vibrio phage K250 g1]
MMNLGFYHPSHNPYGCKRSSDDKYWHNTTVAFNTTADCFNPSKLLTNSGTIASGKSGRDDGRYWDAVYEGGLGGIVDYRLGAVANDSPEEAAKVEAKVENGTYRGLEKLVRSTPYSLGASTGTQTAFLGVRFASTGKVTSVGQVGSLAKETEVVGHCVSMSDSQVYPVYGYVDDGSTMTVYLNQDGFNAFAIAQRNESANAVLCEETNLSVSGEFNAKMVIADPVNFLKVFPNGILGTWCPVIPKAGTSNRFPMSRKSLVNTNNRVYTDSFGVSWTANSLPVSTITNDTNPTYPRAEFVAIHYYKAFAKQTKPSTSKSVLNATKGLLGVTVTQSHDKSVLAEAVAGIILKSDVSGIVTEQSQAVKYLVDGTIKRLKTLPSDMAAPTNSSQAVRIAVYQISNNGQTSLAIIANTMTHNGTSWGELDEIQIPSSGSGSFTDTNGTVQQAICTELSMASGWTSNHARTGPQVAGVDL